jgi:Protein of unknown function (DUF2889)
VTTNPQATVGPATTTIGRGPISVRRTSHIDMVLSSDAFAGPLQLLGRARDLYTDAAGAGTVISEADVDAGLDGERRLRTLRTSPQIAATEMLSGLVVGPGFRSALSRAVGREAAARSPLYLLLDDLPVAALISGYAALYRSGPPGPRSGGVLLGERPGDDRTRTLQGDICAGWRNDGTMMVALRSGRGMPVSVGPVAPPLEDPHDPLGWHDIEDMRSGSMRRRRLIDVTGVNPLVVRAMFRDSHKAIDGVETVLHEYSVEASVNAETMRFESCRAAPHSLPWPECPEAAGSAARLIGEPVQNLREFVRANLTGIATCTHLNDLLRSMADVSVLARLLPGAEPEPPLP